MMGKILEWIFGELFQWICNTPAMWIPTLLLVLLVIGAWIREQFEEAKAGEKLRQSERNRDSLWND